MIVTLKTEVASKVFGHKLVQKLLISLQIKFGGIFTSVAVDSTPDDWFYSVHSDQKLNKTQIKEIESFINGFVECYRIFDC